MMKDLTELVGLPIQLDAHALALSLGEGVVYEQMIPRRTDQQSDVLHCPPGSADQIAYVAYRGIRARRADATRAPARLWRDGDLLDRHSLRFDIVILNAGRVGDEFIKTSGHEHQIAPGTNVTYPEVYFVLSGRATYLLERFAEERTVQAVVIELRAGRALLVPPGWGHVTCNAGSQPMVMCNWICSKAVTLRDRYTARRGGSYLLLDRGGEPVWQPNPNCPDPPPLQRARAGAVIDDPFPAYRAVMRSPEAFRWLVDPTGSDELFQRAW